MSKEESFQHELESLYQVVGRATGYWANYYLRSVRKNGAVVHAKKALSTIGSAQGGFQKLIEVGRPELSMEYSVLKPEFKSLFTELEINEAKRRLSAVPEYAWRKEVEPEQNFSGEIVDNSIFTEGAKKHVTVNSYERCPKARKACLDKYGYRCRVCDFSFSEVYGEIGKNFIHVHHIKPLAGISEEYAVEPTKDLVPVCPNCHAMLHTQNPPLSIDELKSILVKSDG
ncbi:MULTISPECIES: HNH endonuclease [Vibrio harveyi group]|uniref:HNH endonuclease n=1 Tax=Vibrio harveyi group TaxID=717610 RepID=UPI00040D282E|nr:MULTISPECIES: HNH endonuclease [Vibrio harveyi group]MCS0435123.1 HNH endonuclease [Vibrio diabolicus]